MFGRWDMRGVMVRGAQSSKVVLFSLVALQAIGLVFAALMLFPLVAQWHTLDLSLYAADSQRLLQGQIPYRDFPIEYPPLALVPFTLPRLVLGRPLSLSGYVLTFLLENVLFSTMIALAITHLVLRQAVPRAPRLTLALYTLFAVYSAPLLPWRYDLFPALLTALALLSVLRGRPAWAGIWAGLGVAAKLYPIVLLPVFGLYYLAGGQHRAIARMIAGSATAILLSLLPFLFAFTAPAKLFGFLSYHQLRGLQLESLPAGAIVLAHNLGLTGAKLEFNYGALHVVSPWASTALAWLPFAFLAVYSVVAAAAWGRFREECAEPDRPGPTAETLVAFVFAALLAFIATNKVFSPQYLIWLLPFAPLLRPRQALLFLAILLLTMTLFPFDYSQLLAMRRLPVLLLNLRNLLVIGLLGWLVIEQAPASALSCLPWRMPSHQRAREA